MIKSLLKKFHLWIGTRDFMAAHIHLAKSNKMCTIINGDNLGTTISVYTSDPDMVDKITSTLMLTAEEIANG